MRQSTARFLILPVEQRQQRSQEICQTANPLLCPQPPLVRMQCEIMILAHGTECLMHPNVSCMTHSLSYISSLTSDVCHVTRVISHSSTTPHHHKHTDPRTRAHTSSPCLACGLFQLKHLQGIPRRVSRPLKLALATRQAS